MSESVDTRASFVVADAAFLLTTRQMAIAVSDSLATYFTTYWPGRVGRRLLRVPRLDRELARRSLPPELSARAESLQTMTEFVRVALGRVGVHALDRRLIWRRNIAFDRQVATMIPPSTTVIGHYGASLACFERAQRLGGKRLMDYPIARVDFTEELLSQEARLKPLFADTISGPHALTIEPEHLRRIAAEADLADLIIVGSRFAAESFAKTIHPSRIAIVPYGVDTNAFHPALERNGVRPLRVLFAGQLTQRKGIAYLLEAMELLDRRAFELTLVGPIIGSGRGLQQYEGQFRHLAGVSPQEMPAIYRQADVLVLPSLAEGSAYVVLEALASGLPVIVTPNVGADAVTDGREGFVIPIRSPEAIAARLDLLASNPELRLKMGRAAFARSETLSWSTFHERIREVALHGLPTTNASQDSLETSR